MKARLITDADKKTAAAYENSNPKQLGNLHERMQYVMACLEKARADGKVELPHDLYQGIFDLATEVKYHTPATPPFGRRVVTLSKKPSKKATSGG